jgi:hypothetical protein
MELQKGDKLIPPIAKVVECFNDTSGVRLMFDGLAFAIFGINELKNWRKVLGLVGDEGLEPEVGMKVWDSTFGEGEIVDTEYTPAFPIAVEFVSAGRPRACYSRNSERTLYVTERAPKEPLGWAWFMAERTPYTYTEKLTYIQAQQLSHLRRQKLIHWIPETEV